MVRHAHRITGVATDPQNREKDDFYPTPASGTKALLSVEKFDGPIWEPACGDGAISRVLVEHGHEVISTDLVDRGYGQSGVDFLMEWKPAAPNMITNPPFKIATEWMAHSIRLAKGKVALLLRLACLEGGKRRLIYDKHPPARVWVFSSRLTMWRDGVATSDAGGTTAFAWFVWEGSGSGETRLGWIDPVE